MDPIEPTRENSFWGRIRKNEYWGRKCGGGLIKSVLFPNGCLGFKIKRWGKSVSNSGPVGWKAKRAKKVQAASTFAFRRKS